MVMKSNSFNASEHLDDEDIALYISDAIANKDVGTVARTIGVVAKARGMSRIARETGLTRESLYKSLSGEQSPRFETIVLVLKALGFRLNVEPDHEDGVVGRLGLLANGRTNLRRSLSRDRSLRKEKGRRSAGVDASPK
jgi:probable addiction module antidote protein